MVCFENILGRSSGFDIDPKLRSKSFFYTCVKRKLISVTIRQINYLFKIFKKFTKFFFFFIELINERNLRLGGRKRGSGICLCRPTIPWKYVFYVSGQFAVTQNLRSVPFTKLLNAYIPVVKYVYRLPNMSVKTKSLFI